MRFVSTTRRTLAILSPLAANHVNFVLNLRVSQVWLRTSRTVSFGERRVKSLSKQGV